jgi:hypothetical protein
MGLDPERDGGLAEAEERLLEVLVRSVIEEAEGPAARGGVVDNLGHEALVLAEVQLVAYAYLARGLDDDVPEPLLAVEFPEQEDHDVGAGLLLLAEEAGGEDFRVIEDEGVTLAEIVDDVLEKTVFDGSGLAVEYEQSAFVAPPGWFLRHPVLGKDELELGEFHVLDHAAK